MNAADRALLIPERRPEISDEFRAAAQEVGGESTVEAAEARKSRNTEGNGEADAVTVHTPADNDGFGAAARGRESDVSPSQEANMSAMLVGMSLASGGGRAQEDEQEAGAPQQSALPEEANAPNRGALNAEHAAARSQAREDFNQLVPDQVSEPTRPGVQNDAADRDQLVNPDRLAANEALNQQQTRQNQNSLTMG